MLVSLPSCQPEEHLSLFQEPTQRYPTLNRWYTYPLKPFVPHQTLYWNILPDRFNSLSLKYCVLTPNTCWNAVYNRYLKMFTECMAATAMPSTNHWALALSPQNFNHLTCLNSWVIYPPKMKYIRFCFFKVLVYIIITLLLTSGLLIFPRKASSKEKVLV